MFLFTALRIASRALAANRLRTGLTILGIMVGIGAVLCTVAVGQGGAAQVHNDLLNLGDNFVWLENGNRNVGGVRTGIGGVPKLTVEDMQAILADVPEIVRCSAQVDGRTQMIAGNQNWNTTFRGVSPDYLQIRKWAVRIGEPFTDADVTARAKVAVLGQTVSDQLFGEEDPVDKPIRIGPQIFKVLGVLTAKGAASTGVNQDDFVLIPYTAAMRFVKGSVTLDDIMCSASSDAAVPTAQGHILTLMRERHRIGEGQADDFNIQTPDEQIKMREDAARTMATMLAGIAAVSLVVGGIGIMNIMLVSVAERTREIGIRLAIGAREGDVRIQFLVEALLLGVVGGVAGIALGFAAAQVLGDAYDYAVVISADTVAVAVGVATATGLIFGYYPAHHASTLDPIEALRAD
jgi:putative ABC transport system permease protein